MDIPAAISGGDDDRKNKNKWWFSATTKQQRGQSRIAKVERKKDTELLITERDCPESERVAWSLKTETGTKRDRPVASSTCHGEDKKKKSASKRRQFFYHVGFITALLFAGFCAGVGIFSVARVSGGRRGSTEKSEHTVSFGVATMEHCIPLWPVPTRTTKTWIRVPTRPLPPGTCTPGSRPSRRAGAGWRAVLAGDA